MLALMILCRGLFHGGHHLHEELCRAFEAGTSGSADGAF
jgi:hypothetical protein